MTLATKTTQPAISIIVPVYNVEDFLADALNSILQQIFSQPVEILLVDDCSTDNSKQICNDFVLAHPDKIKLFCHSENSGISVARNTGLAAVAGTYFTFVDPDDLLPPNALQNLYDAAVLYNADIVKGNHLIFDEHNCHPANTNVSRTTLLEGDAILTAFFAHQKVRGFTWGKLFKSDRLVTITNKPGVKMKQDTLYCAELFSLAQKLVLIDQDIYQYRLRNTGITAQKFRTGNYLWWLYAIENAGHFARTPLQRAHHKTLQIDVLLQLADEANQLDDLHLASILKEITHRQSAWRMTSAVQLFNTQLPLQAWVKYFTLKLKLIRLQKRLNTPLTING